MTLHQSDCVLLRRDDQDTDTQRKTTKDSGVLPLGSQGDGPQEEQPCDTLVLDF
jgi:hypothetical protein